MPLQKELLDYFNDFYRDPDPIISHPAQGDIFIPCNEEEECLGIIVISNACDIEKQHKNLRNKNLVCISYLPIFTPESINLKINSENLDKWIKIITLNHPALFYLPPKDNYIENKGAIINFQYIRSMKIDDFIRNYPNPCVTLKGPYRDKLGSSVCHLFNRIPINNPDENNKTLFKDFLFNS